MKKYIKYLLIFSFFLILLFLSPISGDDWGNFLVGKSGLYKSITNAVGMYFDWEGRFVSRILINILTYHKYLWNIINSLVLISIVFIIIKFIKPKNKKIIFLLSFLMIVLMNIFTFSQTITWVAGNITYMFVIPLILGYLYFILNNDQYNKKIMFLLIILNIIMTMFIEHMALVLIVGNITILMYKYLKTKKLDKRIIIYLIISIISFLTMFLSPGNAYRNTIENLDFIKLNIFEKIIYNIPNFIYYTFIINYFFLIISLFTNVYLINKTINKKILKIITYLYMTIIPLISVIAYLITMFKYTVLSSIINQNNIIVIIYWTSYLLIMIYLFYKYCKIKNNYLPMLFILLGLTSNGVMLLSPTWGFRTSLFTYFCFCISSFFIIDELKIKKQILLLIEIIIIGSVILNIIFFININICQKEIEKAIKNGLERKEKVIHIEAFPIYANCDINPSNDYHMKHYKEYYNIPEKVELVFERNHWKYLIIY